MLLDCAVLDNGQRILAASSVFKAFGRPRKGANSRLEIDGTKIPPFLAAKNLEPYINQEVMAWTKTIEYMDMIAINGSIAGLRLAGDILKGMLDLKTFNDSSGKVAELQNAILSAQSNAMASHAAQFSMVEEIRALKEEMAQIKAWDTEKQRYKLTTPWEGSLTYALKESMSNGEPPHYICTSCYENRRKSILNPKQNSTNRFYSFVCPNCKTNAAAAQYASE